MKWALLLLAACGSSEPPAADCSTVSNGIKQYWAERAVQTTDVEELAAIHEQQTMTADKFERHCRADRWAPDLIACARVVFRLDDSGCLKLMNNQQRAQWLNNETAPPIKGGMGIGN